MIQIKLPFGGVPSVEFGLPQKAAGARLLGCRTKGSVGCSGETAGRPAGKRGLIARCSFREISFDRGHLVNRTAVAACRQCDIKTGTVIEARIPRVAPPRTNSRQREWP
jgi:hypothetical protein